jgi:branched-chain amino acid aminotransferase
VDDGKLSTPAVGVLPGITRRTVFDLCAESGLAVTTTDVSVATLRQSDEVFITSTAGGIMPVTMIDGVPVADGKVGAITRRLMAVYWQKHEDPAWSSPVRYP